MNRTTRPKLVFFQAKPNRNLANFVLLHRQQHVKCLSEFFEVVLIQKDSDYQEICDKHQPDLVLFEHPGNFPNVQKLKIKNTHAYPKIPKVGLHNEDSWCSSRKAFIAEMENWGIETFFSICTTLPEHMPEISKNLFIWPNFIDAELHKDYYLEKVTPVFLTGASYSLYPWRQRVYNLISQHYPALSSPHLGYDKHSASQMLQGEQYARAINASWFVPTCGTIAREVVRKHFEIPGAGACLLTERSPNLEAAGFVDMQNCVFVDEHNVLDKLAYLFQHPNELEGIIKAGYELVQARHTLKHRDQLLQWFNLHKKLQPNQMIVQSTPFSPLAIVEKSPEVRSAPIFWNGAHWILLRLGDEKLLTGDYDSAKAYYFQCLEHVSIMPEPNLRLALCHLYQGDAEAALERLVPMIQTALENDQTTDPDPVEAAYCMIALLCLGKVNEAERCAKRFQSLNHIELDRTRWLIGVLQGSKSEVLLQNEVGKHRYSVHQLPEYRLEDWIEQVYRMLFACHQVNLAELLRKSLPTGIPDKAVSGFASAEVLTRQSGITNRLKKLPVISKVVYALNPYPFKSLHVARLKRTAASLKQKIVELMA